MPTHLYLTAHLNAKWVRLFRSNFLAYQNSLGLSGGCKHIPGREFLLIQVYRKSISISETQVKWNSLYLSINIKQQLMIVTQNSCEVNREPTQIYVAFSVCDFDQTELSCNIVFQLDTIVFLLVCHPRHNHMNAGHINEWFNLFSVITLCKQ